MNPLNRRSFLTKSAAGALGLTILPNFISKAAPSDKLRVAHIGLGGMGNNHMNWFAKLPDVDIVALCDVDSDHLNSTFKILQGLVPNTKAKLYGDFRKILDDKEIDAISVATPDHWHAQIATMAFQAGKDVYGEKPLSYDIAEGQIMLKTLKKEKKIFQLGTQIHAGDNYHRVAEIIKSGAIGDVHTVRLWKTGGAPDMGNPSPSTPPSTFNYDMWLGPAPKVPYIKERTHFTYRYFLDYSGGVFADFWCHIADIVWWSIEPKGLTSVAAKGEKPDGIADAPKWLDAEMQFDGLKLYWTTEPPNVPGAKDRGIGAYFEGSKGTLICDYGSMEITINGETVKDIPEVPKTIIRSPGHQQNFVDAVKARTQPESNLEYARAMTLPMHLALISYRLGRPLQWNAKKEQFVGDAEANGYLSREYRKEWNFIK
ncbi:MULTISPECIES: Gfo/Idh/MocA family protein [unclassified Imperialibacter]|uniref:Gfo/Idh/MocA family protein n=1 Tax=unclassified Imperialibacter TaxID=2629706 RepID=UPI00125C11C6|nr:MULTISPECIES: Gfo/Idh/MocA family oxidoreductase [unclassified Imperialibacter]CAD5278957.1 Gfo/Idh/MocA family oxidoreductase [Imperialibacter sp. 89]CAD5293068.1 Gfo/Idh/MocA family oxidoreductase [Imperialibacter sp. 75]VVS99173.1 Tat (Twin-arginine translocation) pathway signal sequence [Imperialibacter sp. EC-SDR9]